MQRSISFVTTSLVALALALPALAQQTNTAPPPAYMYRHHFWHGGFFGPLLMVIVIFALVALFRRFGFWGPHGYRYHRAGSALHILEERFARGEIDKAEFEEKRKLLMR
ncbi:MAG TPA: SHOCT domain-containing protein [Stellaceae bacterium]|jgi:putative membrane protein